jgi:hypothetical protein
LLVHDDFFNHVRIEVRPTCEQTPQLKTGEVNLGLGGFTEGELVICRALEENLVDGEDLRVLLSDAEVVGLVAVLEQKAEAFGSSGQI